MSAQVSNMSAQISRTRISKDDFEEAAKYLQAMRGGQSTVVKRALLIAAIIAYARPFSNNEDSKGNRATPILKARPSKLLTTQEKDLHGKLLTLRNEALAHSQYDRKAIKRLNGSSGGFVMQGRAFDILSESIDYITFESLCSKMERHCVNQLFDLNRKLSAHEAKP